MRRIVLLFMIACLVAVPIALPSIGLRAQGTSSYTVQPGDNLYRISLKFGVTQAVIAQANGITNPNLIFVGQVLQIPGGTGSSGGTQPTAAPGATAVPAASGTYT